MGLGSVTRKMIRKWYNRMKNRGKRDKNEKKRWRGVNRKLKWKVSDNEDKVWDLRENIKIRTHDVRLKIVYRLR